jgi:hypothetical protein
MHMAIIFKKLFISSFEPHFFFNFDRFFEFFFPLNPIFSRFNPVARIQQCTRMTDSASQQHARADRCADFCAPAERARRGCDEGVTRGETGCRCAICEGKKSRSGQKKAP